MTRERLNRISGRNNNRLKRRTKTHKDTDILSR
jgi:hypothetical protein